METAHSQARLHPGKQTVLAPERTTDSLKCHFPQEYSYLRPVAVWNLYKNRAWDQPNYLFDSSHQASLVAISHPCGTLHWQRQRWRHCLLIIAEKSNVCPTVCKAIALLCIEEAIYGWVTYLSVVFKPLWCNLRNGIISVGWAGWDTSQVFGGTCSHWREEFLCERLGQCSCLLCRRERNGEKCA